MILILVVAIWTALFVANLFLYTKKNETLCVTDAAACFVFAPLMFIDLVGADTIIWRRKE